MPSNGRVSITWFYAFIFIILPIIIKLNLHFLFSTIRAPNAIGHRPLASWPFCTAFTFITSRPNLSLFEVSIVLFACSSFHIVHSQPCIHFCHHSTLCMTSNRLSTDTRLWVGHSHQTASLPMVPSAHRVPILFLVNQIVSTLDTDIFGICYIWHTLHNVNIYKMLSIVIVNMNRKVS